MESLRDIDLIKIIDEYPNITRSNAKLRAMLLDFYPENKLEVNLVSFFHGLGINSKMKKKAYLSGKDIVKLTTLMERTYGTSYAYAYYAISQWANAFGIKCAPAVETISSSPIRNTNIDSSPGNTIGMGDVIFEDKNIKVSLKSIEGFDFSETHQYFHINCIIQNKSQKDVYVSLFDIEMNGIVFEDVKGNELIHPNKTMMVKFLFNQDKLCEIGYSSVDEFEIMTFEVAYSYKNIFYDLKHKVGSKVVNIDMKEIL